MALTAKQNKGLAYVIVSASKTMAEDDAVAYIIQLKTDDVFATSELAAFAAKRLPQVAVDLGIAQANEARANTLTALFT